jgi:DNA-directed RNA polymerase subunit H
VTKFAVRDHELVPEHLLLSREEGEVVLRAYGIEATQLPKIHVNDPAAKNAKDENGRDVEAKVGDIIKIIRKSPTAKESVFYRLVID